MFLLLSNAEREENGNTKQWSNFPSHIQPQAEMMSGFTSKTSLNAAIFERRKSKGNIDFSKSASADSTGSVLTAKSETNQDCVWHMDVTLVFTDWGKIVQKPFSPLCQTIPEGIIRLVTFTLKICNFLLNHKKLYWSSNCCNFWELSIISAKLLIIHELKKEKTQNRSLWSSYWNKKWKGWTW